MLSNEPTPNKILDVTRTLLAEFGHEEYEPGRPRDPRLQYGVLEFCRSVGDDRFSILIGIDVGSWEGDDPSAEFMSRLSSLLKRSGSGYEWRYTGLGASGADHLL